MVRSTTKCDFHRNRRHFISRSFPNGNQNVCACACLCIKTLEVYGILNINIIIFLTINFQRRESLTKIIIVFMEFHIPLQLFPWFMVVHSYQLLDDHFFHDLVPLSPRRVCVHPSDRVSIKMDVCYRTLAAVFLLLLVILLTAIVYLLSGFIVTRLFRCLQ